MNVDKKTVKIVLASLVIALIWSWPAIRMYGGIEATAGGVITSVLIRVVIVFAVIRFIFWIVGKKK
jgi:O-antigen/teichoic acid export membrane protein